MGKTDYLDALKQAMTGLPEQAQAKTLAYYEQRFVDGVAAGRSEEEVAAELDDPKKIAMTLRANTHMQGFAEKKNPANLLRMMVSAVGLAIFNLFMVVPAMVYGSLVAALYASAVAFYLVGVVLTGAGLSGASQIDLSGPLRQWAINHDMVDEVDRTRTTVSFSELGINVTQDPVNMTEADRAAAEAREQAETARETAAAAREEAHAAREQSDSSHDEAEAVRAEVAAAREEAAAARREVHRTERIFRRAEGLAEGGLVINTDLDANTRSRQTVFGLGMVFGGILLFLLSLVVTRYTFIGIRRYIDMNLSLLRGH